MNRETQTLLAYTPSVLAKSLQRGGDQIAIEFESQRITRADLRDWISRYCKTLKSLGAARGCRVAFLSRNRPELIYFTCAALMSDLCVVPLHVLSSVDDCAYICNDAQVDILIFDSYFEDFVSQLKKPISTPLYLALGPCKDSQFTDLHRLAQMQAPEALLPPPVHGDDICRLSYTGGTTGRPRAAMITYRAFLHMLMVQLIEWEWPSEIRHLVCAPLSHAGASAVLPTLIREGCLVLLPSFEATQVLQTIETSRITSTLLVPSMIYKLLDHPQFNVYKLTSLQTIFYGASSISAERLHEAIRRIGSVFYQFYAQAEAPMVVTGFRKADHDPSVPGRLTSCGRPMPWIDVALLGRDDSPVAQGTAGELCIRGPIVMAGYLHKPEESAAAFAGDWLRTGDIAVADSDGFLHIVDRKKDMIVTGGYNVFSREVEDALCAHPSVAQACVYGVPDSVWGEAVHAAVTLRDGMQVEPTELIAFVKAKKGKAHAPKAIKVLASIPLTSLGKPDKVALRARISAAEAAQSAVLTNTQTNSA